MSEVDLENQNNNNTTTTDALQLKKSLDIIKFYSVFFEFALSVGLNCWDNVCETVRYIDLFLFTVIEKGQVLPSKVLDMTLLNEFLHKAKQRVAQKMKDVKA